MRMILFVVTLCIVTSSFAAQVETDCLSINDNREKNVKLTKPKNMIKKPTGSAQ